MSNPTKRPFAYGIFRSGIWSIFCPECWGKQFGFLKEADADLIESNGDKVGCHGCGKEMS
jgi:hypothetical protein